MSGLLIYNALIVNEGERFNGYITTSGEIIESVERGDVPAQLMSSFAGKKIDAKGMLVIPGVIDDQVHFREPGLTDKADIHSESIAAVAGGVTSYMEMPNTNPPTTSIEQWEWKMDRAAVSSVANYSFYFGASNDNVALLSKIDTKRVCGVKLFMGSSTGNMFVNDEYTLSAIFAESPILIATHCEDEATVRANMELYRAKYGDSATAALHPLIRNAEACYRSSARAVELADKYGSNLNVLHLSTAKELTLFDSKPLAEKKITNEVCVHHLWFTDSDYAAKGNFIKWNPAVKGAADRDALRDGIKSGKVDIVATDHAPHTFDQKSKGYWDAPSGGPLVQHSLVSMLEMVKDEIFTLEQVVDKMCHAAAIRYNVSKRGFLRAGYFADIVIVDQNREWNVDKSNILYKCGWSPFEGQCFGNSVHTTIINGFEVYSEGVVDKNFIGQPLDFER